MHIHSPHKPKKLQSFLPTRRLMADGLDGRGEIHSIKNHNKFKIVLWNTKKLRKVIQNKKRGLLTFSIVILHDNARARGAARTRTLLEHLNWELFDSSLTALLSLQRTAACLSTWRTGWDHRALTTMRSSWKVSKHGWDHRQQASLTQETKNLFPDMTSSYVGK
jgi:hypothetical protein